MDAGLHPSDLLAQRAFLRRLARGLLGDDGLAEEVVAEAELRAHMCGPRERGALANWLATVTRRLALNAARARERRREHEHRAARPEAVPGHDEALEGLELQRRVLAAVQALDEPLRTVLWQRFYEDRPPR
jgi:DNA-directed RNA polymerase specialized sigma24 family protein